MRYGMSVSTAFEWLAHRARKIPVPILDVMVAPMQAQALIAAVEVGIFASLARGHSRERSSPGAARLTKSA